MSKISQHTPWVHTAGGGQVSLLTPSPDDISIMDIAEGLAKQCRYNGQLQTFYSVAQHSVLVMELLPDEFKAYGLLHDAHEAYLGDITSPVQRAIETVGSKRGIKKLKQLMDEAIYRAFGLKFPIPNDIKDLIHHADLVALATEKRDLISNTKWDVQLPSPTGRMIRAQAWPEALENFINAFHHCTTLTPQMVNSPAFKNHTRKQDCF